VFYLLDATYATTFEAQVIQFTETILIVARAEDEKLVQYTYTRL
jgi:hypothetical protein